MHQLKVRRCPRSLYAVVSWIFKEKDFNAVEPLRKCYAVIIVGAPTLEVEEFRRTKTQQFRKR